MKRVNVKTSYLYKSRCKPQVPAFQDSRLATREHGFTADAWKRQMRAPQEDDMSS